MMQKFINNVIHREHKKKVIKVANTNVKILLAEDNYKSLSVNICTLLNTSLLS